jgi:uncharacterized protein with PIN domain
MSRLGVTDLIRPLTRCTMSNGILAQASAAEVVDRVPPGPLYHQRRFTVRTACARSIGKELTMSGSHGLSQAR